MIQIKDLYKSFGTQKVLSGINLDIEDGEVVAILGPSGTGKSVLLKIITGLLKANSGSVTIGEDSITAAKSSREQEKIRSKMGVLFQTAALFDSINLLENVAFPLKYRTSLSRREIFNLAYEGLLDVGLEKEARSLPGEVPIGIRKRVGIARALVSKPNVILFDEPNTGLDPETGQEIYDLIKEIHSKRAFTGIVISHEIPEVFQVCSRVVMLYNGQIQADGDVESVTMSENPVVKQFMNGSMEGPIQIN